MNKFSFRIFNLKILKLNSNYESISYFFIKFLLKAEIGKYKLRNEHLRREETKF